MKNSIPRLSTSKFIYTKTQTLGSEIALQLLFGVLFFPFLYIKVADLPLLATSLSLLHLLFLDSSTSFHSLIQKIRSLIASSPNLCFDYNF
ncbi:unnamed protein product [Malus baccata var. baccata]